MTKFEQIGSNKQYNAWSKKDAIQFFNQSCTLCSYKGIRINCNQCAIKYAHEIVIACFNDRLNESKKGGDNHAEV